MDAYYQQQIEMPHFSGYNRQRGRGIGALVAGVGRVALPFMRKVLLPMAKQVGKEFLTQAGPEFMEVMAQRKTPTQALKQTIVKTVRKQVGRGVKKKQAAKRKRTITNKDSAKRSRSDFFSNVKHDY